MFGFVQRKVGVLHQCFRAFGVVGVEGDADACATAYFLIHQSILACQIFHEFPSQDARRSWLREMCLHHHKFVSSKAHYQVGYAYVRLDPLSHISQEEVAYMMSQRVVNGFEPVQIQEVNSHHMAIPFGVGQCFRQPILERSAICQPG